MVTTNVNSFFMLSPLKGSSECDDSNPGQGRKFRGPGGGAAGAGLPVSESPRSFFRRIAQAKSDLQSVECTEEPTTRILYKSNVKKEAACFQAAVK
jgi:hypothetical protein